MGVSSDKIAKEICDIFGLKHVRMLNLHFAVGNFVRATVEFYPEENKIRQLIPILEHYRLEEQCRAIPKAKVILSEEEENEL